MPLTSLQRSLVWLGVVLMATVAHRAEAQYFGQNKVQYNEFAFKVLETPHFDIYYYPAEAEAAQQVARMAERWRERLGTVLDHQLSGRQPIVLYGSHPEFEQTNVVEGAIDEGTGGVTEGQRRRVVLPLAASLAETDHVLGHELVHTFQYDILGRNAGGVPLWFIEGMAEYLSLGPRSPQTAMWLRDAAIEGTLPTIAKLDDPHYFPYRFGHAFWAYIGGRFGDRMIGDILKSVAIPGGGSVDPVKVIESATAMKQDALSTEWHQSIRALYNIQSRDTPASAKTDRKPAPGGPVMIGENSGSGALNVGPSISPDGTQVAFLSERSRLAIDLYVADTSTGKVIHTLTKTAVDPHFQSLQFLQSAGAWSPDGKQLAVATVRDGRGRLTIFDVDSERVDREFSMAERGEIFQPAWSPDGSKIAYAAQIGGLTDLFLYDLATSSATRLTNDDFADLQPTWAPDGGRLIFTTDRAASDLKALAFGPYRLASMNVSTGAVTAIETGLAGNAVNPQLTGDGRSLYFISDDTGRPEIYRAEADGSRPQLVASAPTGISGITPLSPALSIATHASRGAYTVFRQSGYEIQFLDLGSAAAPMADTATPARDLALLAAPSERVSAVAQELSRPTPEQAATAAYPTKKYSPRLSLLAAGQQLGVATGGTFGTYVSGGVSLLFSDVLGDHLLGTTFDVNGSARDVGANVSYINRTHRWNWGVFGERVPLLSGSVQARTGISNGQLLYVETTDLFRQTYTTVGASLAYPFSRATRFEISASGNRIGFDHEVQTQAFDTSTGALVVDTKDRVDTEPALRMFETSAAVIRDTTAFGPVGPILGQRLRLEVAPTFGDLHFVNATADLRQYAMPIRPLVLAGRAMHIGRYGGGSEDQRLIPLFLGYPSLVRGYDANSFDAGECTVTADGSCPEFDRLVGSRAVVVNAEARMPMFGFGGNLNYGPVPTELYGFFDAGVAWTRASSPSLASLRPGDREWVKSVGVGARVNALGFAILEFNLARPLDRPARGWMFVFNLRPGF